MRTVCLCIIWVQSLSFFSIYLILSTPVCRLMNKSWCRKVIHPNIRHKFLSAVATTEHSVCLICVKRQNKTPTMFRRGGFHDESIIIIKKKNYFYYFNTYCWVPNQMWLSSHLFKMNLRLHRPFLGLGLRKLTSFSPQIQCKCSMFWGDNWKPWC